MRELAGDCAETPVVQTAYGYSSLNTNYLVLNLPLENLKKALRLVRLNYIYPYHINALGRALQLAA